jgi:bifunctional pyridoxal-dependent enzyme with beta-cystathionase and maltose regulon repressor activities
MRARRRARAVTGRAEHGVTLASASKAFNIAGLKGAVAVAGSASIQGLLRRLPAASQYGAGLLGVLASLAAWESGAQWLDTLIAQLDHAARCWPTSWTGWPPPSSADPTRPGPASSPGHQPRQKQAAR